MISVILVAGSVLLTFILLFLQLRRPKNFPPGPQWYPIFGNVLQIKRLSRRFGSQHEVYKELSSQAKSSLVGLKLGGKLTVVACGFDAVTAVFNSDALLGRPDGFFIRLRTLGSRRGITMTDGALWVEQRRFAARHFRRLGYGGLTMLRLMTDELQDLLAILGSGGVHNGHLNGSPNGHSKGNHKGDLLHVSNGSVEGTVRVAPAPLLAPAVLNVVWALTAGSRFSPTDPRLRNLLDLLGKRGKVFDLSGGWLTSIPWLRFIAPSATGYCLMKEVNTQLRNLLQETISSHKASYNPHRTRDLIDAYLHEIREHEGKPSSFTEEQLIMVCVDMFIAGSYTTSYTLCWALHAMIAHPDVQARCYKDIFNAVEKDRLPSLEDKTKLPYIEAVLMEVMRINLVIPIVGPRRALQKTQLLDYTLPKDTTVLADVWSVHHDPEHWKDPEVFRPERFLAEDGTLRTDAWLMGFGMGKRRCLGDTLARHCLFLFFTGILQRYRLSVVPGEELPRAPTSSGFIRPPPPFEMMLTPRNACPGSPRVRSKSPVPPPPIP